MYARARVRLCMRVRACDERAVINLSTAEDPSKSSLL